MKLRIRKPHDSLIVLVERSKGKHQHSEIKPSAMSAFNKKLMQKHAYYTPLIITRMLQKERKVLPTMRQSAVVSNQSFSVVENRSFISFLNTFRNFVINNPNRKAKDLLPCQRTISNRVEDALKSVKNEVSMKVAQLKASGGFSIYVLLISTYGFIYYGSEIKLWNSSISTARFIARCIARFKILLSVLTLNAPIRTDKELVVSPVSFLFADDHRLSFIGGEQALTNIVQSLFLSAAFIMKDLRPAIIRAHEAGRGAREIARFLDITPMMVSRAINRFEEIRSNKDRTGRGRKKTARSKKNIQRAKEGRVSHGLGAISARGKTPLVFVDQKTKIDRYVYMDMLNANLISWTNNAFGDDVWTFQQDGAPGHKAYETQDWLREKCPDVITVDPHWRVPTGEWPPNSPDLNPMDYSVWSILKEKACKKPHPNVESLKKALKKAWKEIDLETLVKIVDNFPQRLKACINANSEEHYGSLAVRLFSAFNLTHLHRNSKLQTLCGIPVVMYGSIMLLSLIGSLILFIRAFQLDEFSQYGYYIASVVLLTIFVVSSIAPIYLLFVRLFVNLPKRRMNRISHKIHLMPFERIIQKLQKEVDLLVNLVTTLDAFTNSQTRMVSFFVE
uniref:KAP NTPase domain-containing protein n=1 Tax=Ditylenchus dipsaci TaxID=166011 RepID=A0A915ECL3_9BILA